MYKSGKGNDDIGEKTEESEFISLEYVSLYSFRRHNQTNPLRVGCDCGGVMTAAGMIAVQALFFFCKRRLINLRAVAVVRCLWRTNKSRLPGTDKGGEFRDPIRHSLGKKVDVGRNDTKHHNSSTEGQ